MTISIGSEDIWNYKISLEGNRKLEKERDKKGNKTHGWVIEQMFSDKSEKVTKRKMRTFLKAL